MPLGYGARPIVLGNGHRPRIAYAQEGWVTFEIGPLAKDS